MPSLLLLVTLLLMGWQKPLQAQSLIVLSDEDFKQKNIGELVDAYVASSEDSWAVDTRPPSAENFRRASELDLSGAATRTAWIRTTIQNQTEHPFDLVLYTDMALYPLHFYEARGNRFFLISAIDENHKAQQADTFTGTASLAITLAPGETREVYMKFQRKLPSRSINMFLASRSSFQDYAARDIGLRHLFLGITLSILCYNFFFWLKLKRSEYLIYSIYLASYALATSVAFFLALNWSPELWLRKYFWELKAIFYDFTIVTACYFTSSFLKLDKRSPILHRIFLGFCLLFLTNIIVAFFSINLNNQIRSWSSLAFGPLLFGVSVKVARQGYRPAVYFGVGWGILVLSNAISILYQAEFFPHNYLLDWIIPFGASAEMLILSFGLSDNFQIQQRLARKRIEELHEALQTSKDELQKSYDELQRSEAFRTQFFHNTSHELRTPLNGILGYLAMCLRGQEGTISKEIQSTLTKVHRLADSLKHQIDVILNLAKLKRNEVQVHGSDIDLKKLLEQAEQLAEGLCLGQKQCSFQAELVIEPREKDHFVGDHEMLATIVRNLIGNAIKFSDPLRPNLVEFKLYRQRHWLRIEVRDRGIGIPEEHGHAIFEEFHQVHGEERRHYEGTGLGLALVKQYVSLMEGKLELESRVGEGSCFVIQVPELNSVEIARDPEIDEPFSFAQPVEDTADIDIQATQQLQGIKVLIVDDHLANCEILEALLEYQGAEPRFTQNGREALQLMTRQVPDIVLLDMMMPDFSGEDVLLAMQADPLLTTIPVIVITARAGEEDRLQTFKIGADDYLAKPILEQELLLRIKNILNRKQLTQHIAKLESQQKLTLVGETMQFMAQKLRAFTNQADESDVILEDFTKELMGLSAESPHWHRCLTEGVGFDLSQCGTPENSLLSLPSPSTADLRLMAYYLKGFELQEAQREVLWQELMTMKPIKLQAIAASFQNLARHLELNTQSLVTRRILQSALTLCQRDDSDKVCELSAVIDKMICLLEQNPAGKDLQIEFNGMRCEWVLPASALLHIVVRLSTFCIKTFGPVNPGAKLCLESLDEGQMRHLTFALRGLHRDRFTLEQTLLQIQSPDAPSELRLEWQEILQLLAPYQVQCHWSFPSNGPECCLTMRTTAYEASALLAS